MGIHLPPGGPGKLSLAATARLASVLLGLVALWSCRRPPARAGLAKLHDFVAEASLAHTEAETLRLELGTPGARGHLVRGWSVDEGPGPEGTPFVWSSGPASLLEFFLSEPRDLTLELHGFTFADQPGQRLTVLVNDVGVGELEVQPGPRTYAVRVLARALAAGRNRLEIRYAATYVPALRDHGSTDTRQLAIGWNWIGFWPPASETGQINLGRADSRAYLVDGWSKEEEAPSRSPALVWAVGTTSRLRFFVGRVRDLPVAFRCATTPFAGASRETVQVRVNEQPVGSLHVDGQAREHRLVLPQSSLRLGSNVITLVYGRAMAAGPPALAWETLSVLDVARAGPMAPSADVGAGALRVPSGTSLDYYVESKGEAWLTLDEARVDPGCRLRLGMQPDAGPARVIGELRGTVSAASLPLPLAAGGVAQVSFAVVCTEGRTGMAVVGGPALRGESARGIPGPRGHASRPSSRRLVPVIVYLVDTLRADHLGCYGYPKPVSPHIDAFARDALLFTEARSHTSWTRPAVASLFTGLSPHAHGVIGRNDALPPAALTLAGILKAAGYRTGAVVTNEHVSRGYGFANGFDFFREGDETAERANRSAVRWLDQAGRDRPLFLYLHTIEPHDPYEPTGGFRRRFAPNVRTPGMGSDGQLTALVARGGPVDPRIRQELVDLYDAEIATNDAAFGELTAALRARGLYDEALILFCADHGEEFGDHGSWRHGATLYEEMVAVPLLLKRPGTPPGSGRRVAGFVQQADLFTAILDELGLEAVAGRAAPSEPRRVFYSLDLDVHRTAAVQDGDWKLIREGGAAARTELFNLREDPGEAHDVLESRPVRARYMMQLLRAHEQAVSRALPPLERIPDTAQRERLRALGYVE